MNTKSTFLQSEPLKHIRSKNEDQEQPKRVEKCVSLYLRIMPNRISCWWVSPKHLQSSHKTSHSSPQEYEKDNFIPSVAYAKNLGTIISFFLVFTTFLPPHHQSISKSTSKLYIDLSSFYLYCHHSSPRNNNFYSDNLNCPPLLVSPRSLWLTVLL